MKINIVSEYPLWFVVFCLILGALYAGVLYFRFRDENISKAMHRLMAAFRFIAVTVISFLLLSPMVRSLVQTVEKPLIILAQDNSESLLINRDSAYYRTEYLQNLAELSKKIQKKYDLKEYTFGDGFNEGNKVNFSEKQTDIARVFDEISNRYSGRNVGAVILASDGIYNKGINPLYVAEKLKFPVYTVALGDTNLQRDLLVAKINYNKIVFMGNKFPLQVAIAANKLKGSFTRLEVINNNQVVYSKNIRIASDNYFETIDFLLESKETGLQRYRVRLKPLADEITTTNNYKDVFIDVIDARQKVLILYNTPHPDIAAIRQAIEQNENYEVECMALSEFSKSPDGYNLIILHQLPANNNSTRFVSQLDNTSTPVFYIIGSQTNYNAINSLKNGLGLAVRTRANMNEVQAITRGDFPLFVIRDNIRRIIQDFPPLFCPFGTYRAGDAANILLYQKIGSVTTKQPLLMFHQNFEKKTAILCGEGIWRWRLADYAKNNNHDAFNELVHKVVQYLSIKIDKSFFRVKTKGNFLENEDIELDAELYNDSYELVNEPDVNIRIINEKGKKYPFTFSKTSNAYHLNAGILPAGNYRFVATAKLGAKVYEEKGEFIISPVNIESVTTIADHGLLNNISSATGGEMFYPSGLDGLYQSLADREDIKPMIYSGKRFNEIVNLFWVLVLILLLLSAEWFLRKRSGIY